MGYEDSAILRNEQGMYRVSAACFDTHDSCWQEVFRIHRDHPQFKDAWGLAVES